MVSQFLVRYWKVGMISFFVKLIGSPSSSVWNGRENGSLCIRFDTGIRNSLSVFGLILESGNGLSVFDLILESENDLALGIRDWKHSALEIETFSSENRNGNICSWI
ncbi:hypothetical protein C1645_732642 [Glomus cerebriforme]|uniref:Uncharacterized protein n=1 Tax=Glomus cerebriforme TaxID=658196 RepID=A0A397TID1_9GLOM|nr:hypothetical protein C1645_732642 [Glomus cerebriforme]